MGLSTLIACHECDLLHRRVPLVDAGVARCQRCNAVLYRGSSSKDLDRALAYTLGGLVLFLIANAYPIVALEIQANRQEASLYDTVHALWMDGREDVSLLVAFTTLVTPTLEISLLLYLLIPLRFGRTPSETSLVLRFLQRVKPWSMMEVFLLGILVSLVKLEHLAHVEPGIALWAFGALVPILIAAAGAFNPEDIWAKIDQAA